MAGTHFSGPVYSKGGFVGQVNPQTGAPVTGPLFARPAPATVSTAGNVTYSAAQILNGLILRDTGGANRTDPLPTAAAIVAALGGPPTASVGMTIAFTIMNTSAGAFTDQITMGAGGTSGAANVLSAIAQSTSKTFHLQLTNVTAGAEAYTVYA